MYLWMPVLLLEVDSKVKEMDKHYSWKTAKCVRYGEDFTGENHPCYWCGIPPKDMLSKDIVWCRKCGGFECPSCGHCWCNVSFEELTALKQLRNKYCCNWWNFREGLKPEDSGLLVSVPGFKEALDYCRERKGFRDGPITKGMPFTIRL